MTTFIPFSPNTGQQFRFNATLDDAQYNVTVTWNVAGQRWYVNILDLSGNLIVSRPATASPDPAALIAPPQVEVVTSMTWSVTNQGQVAVVMADDSIFVLGDTIQVQGATNSGTGGDSIVNGPFVINTWTDPEHFTFLLNAGAGVVGTIGGSPVLVLDTFALTWSNATGNGVVTAHTEAAHQLDLGTEVDLTISGAVPDGYNGSHRCAIITPSDFTFDLDANPGSNTVPGTFSYDVSLTDGYFASRMVWRESQSRFEISP